MNKILITGAAGLIGSHLADALLKKRYTVIGYDNLSAGNLKNITHSLSDKNFKFIKGDILDGKKVNLAAQKINCIVHLAAAKKIGEDGSALDTLIVNSDGTRNVLEVAKNNKIKVIFASTSDVYGLSQDLPFNEKGNSVIGPATAKRWAYAVSKMYCEQMAFAYYKEFRVPVVILRYFGCFSERASSSGSGGHIPLFIEAVLNNKPVIIHGDGTQTRSMGHVDDIIRGTIRAIENPKAIGEIINIGNDEEASVLKAAKRIHRFANTGKKIKLQFVPLKKIFADYQDIARRAPDLSKAYRLLGYKPRVSFDAALRKALLKNPRNTE